MTLPLPESAFDFRPPYVITAADRERWDVCEEIAREVSRRGEPDGSVDATFVIWTTRSMYHSDIPTGDPSDT